MWREGDTLKCIKDFEKKDEYSYKKDKIYTITQIKYYFDMADDISNITSIRIENQLEKDMHPISIRSNKINILEFFEFNKKSVDLTLEDIQDKLIKRYNPIFKIGDIVSVTDPYRIRNGVISQIKFDIFKEKISYAIAFPQVHREYEMNQIGYYHKNEITLIEDKLNENKS